jgi:hypothetical protein
VQRCKRPAFICDQFDRTGLFIGKPMLPGDWTVHAAIRVRLCAARRWLASDEHRQWVLDFATRLRSDGVEVTLDQWHLHPGDQLPAFMEPAIRDNDYILIVCTPHYAERSNRRAGGVGYEGDIMTAEVFTQRNERKFIPVFALDRRGRARLRRG